jgi:hypothetical protein
MLHTQRDAIEKVSVNNVCDYVILAPAHQGPVRSIAASQECTGARRVTRVGGGQKRPAALVDVSKTHRAHWVARRQWVTK